MEIVTAAQLAERLKITRRTVYRLVRENRIPKKRVGGQWRFDIDEVIKSMSSAPTSRIPSSENPKEKSSPETDAAQ